MPYANVEHKRKHERERYSRLRLEWIAAEGGQCVQCGSTEALQVDHIHPETKESSRIWSWSQARRQAELVKCQVLCYYCHVCKTIDENKGEIPRWAFTAKWL
jgi:5-methylcytosine-specific restriction endonuclease McrA